MGHHLTVKRLSKSFGSLPVLDDWDLQLKSGERLVLLGPSGCGKTTFLRIISGLEQPTSGMIKKETDQIGFVFQEPRLIPWLDVKGNLRFVDEQGDIGEILTQLRLTGFEDYLPSRLSGGMRQRVNLARALITRPKLLILDEAFSSLDFKVKVAIMEDIQQLWLTHRFSIIAVTHDLKEALMLADRIILLSARPSRIIREIEVELETDRSPSMSGLLRLEAELIDMMCGDELNG
ncbi:MAG: ABC transporter ATP-binding protein [Anaerolineae bacterium]|nr:ABC transporter ATP-binding protein [Anaerolineae bacterium]